MWPASTKGDDLVYQRRPTPLASTRRSRKTRLRAAATASTRGAGALGARARARTTRSPVICTSSSPGPWIGRARAWAPLGQLAGRKDHELVCFASTSRGVRRARARETGRQRWSNTRSSRGYRRLWRHSAREAIWHLDVRAALVPLVKLRGRVLVQLGMIEFSWNSSENGGKMCLSALNAVSRAPTTCGSGIALPCAGHQPE